MKKKEGDATVVVETQTPPRMTMGQRIAEWTKNLPPMLRYTPMQPSLGQRLSSLSDKYGLALLISYRLAGCVIVNGVYFALSRGVDVTPLLSLFGYTGDVTQRSVVGSYAASVVFGSIWFPVTVFLAPYPAMAIHTIRTKIFGTTTKAIAHTNDDATTTRS